jgi:hypothetical protein
VPQLRAVPPGEVEQYLKALLFGGAGSGKTFNLTKIPRSYFIDLENGANYPEYQRNLREGGSVYFPTSDIDEVIAEVTTLISVPHNFHNIIIDPITVVFADEADLQEKYVGSDYGKNVAEANKKWRRLAKLLKRAQMNVLMTAYEKAKFDSPGEVIPNGPKDLSHFFDVVLHTQKRGEERVARIVKSRSRTFPDNTVIPFTYEELAARASVELARAAEPIELASADQVAELERLLSVRTDSKDLRDKWLKKAGAEELSEMRASDVAACIAFLNKSNAAAA